MLIERNEPSTPTGRTFSILLKELSEEIYRKIPLEVYYTATQTDFYEFFARRLAKDANILEETTGIPFDINKYSVKGFKHVPALEKMWFDRMSSIFCLEYNLSKFYDDYDAIGGLVLHSLGHVEDFHENSIFTLPGFSADLSPFEHLSGEIAYQLARLVIAIPLEYRAQMNALNTGNVHYLFNGLTNPLTKTLQLASEIDTHSKKKDFQDVINKMYDLFVKKTDRSLLLSIAAADPASIGSLAAMYSHENVPDYMKDTLKKLTLRSFSEIYSPTCSHFSVSKEYVQKTNELTEKIGTFYHKFIHLLSEKRPYKEEIAREAILQFIK